MLASLLRRASPALLALAAMACATGAPGVTGPATVIDATTPAAPKAAASVTASAAPAEEAPPAAEASAEAATPEAPWGSDEDDPLAPKGGLIGAGVGEAFGAGGLGMSGVIGGSTTGTGVGMIGPRAPGGTVAALGAGVQGALDPEIVRRVVTSRMPSIRACYNRALAQDPTLTGRIEPRFVIDSKGSVIQVSDRLRDPALAELRACVLGVFKSMTFPPPTGGGVVIVTYPLTLQPDTAKVP